MRVQRFEELLGAHRYVIVYGVHGFDIVNPAAEKHAVQTFIISDPRSTIYLSRTCR